MRIEKVSVIGLGKLGLCIATVLAYRGFNVVGVDVDPEKVRAVNSAVSPIFEPGLDRLLKRVRKRLRATTDYEEAISATDVTFIVVPTPSEPDGSFSLRYVNDAIRNVARVLARKDSYHLVVLNSTVSPGSMDRHVKPQLEEYVGRRCGDGLGLCYNPEFIALGNVIRGLLRPDFVLIGESDKVAGDLLERMCAKICTNKPLVLRTNFINAEIAKIAINSYITMKITFANMLAEICERTPGADVDVVTRILGSDSRIGPKYLRGGLGYGGPCFPRDNIAFARFAETAGVRAELPLTVHRANSAQVNRVIKIIERLKPPAGTKIGILGLSYKPDTPVVDESQAIMLAKELASKGHIVHVYDPLALEEARKILGNTVTYEKSLDDCVKNADIIILATPWKSFNTINVHGKIIIDCWRLLKDREELKSVNKYIPLGVYSLVDNDRKGVHPSKGE